MTFATGDDITVADAVLLTKRTLVLQLNGADALTTADKAYRFIDAYLNGWRITAVSAYVKGVSSSGAITITLKLNGTSILSTNITIDEGEASSVTAATPAVIDTAHDDLATNDEVEAAVSGAGTGVTYCEVHAIVEKIAT